LELQLLDIGDKLGKVIADGSVWVSKKVQENVDIDPKKLAKDLGRSLAEVKRDVQKEARGVQRDAKKIVNDVKRRVKS
jgi:hypothetical protein